MVEIRRSEKTNRNSDLQATQNPKRPDYAMDHRKELFKTDKAAFEHLHAVDMIDEKSDRETKAAWKEKKHEPGGKNKSRGTNKTRRKPNKPLMRSGMRPRKR